MKPSLKDICTWRLKLFYNLQILKLPDFQKFKLLCFVFECRNRLPLKPFDDYFIQLLSVHDHNTRQAFRVNLLVPIINPTQYGKKQLGMLVQFYGII